MAWIDGGYHVGDQVTTVDGAVCVLRVSLGVLGWVAYEVARDRDILLLFVESLPDKNKEGTSNGDSA